MSRNGHLPDGWNLTQLGDIGRYINGYAFKPSDWQDVGLPIIRIQNLTDSSKPFNRYPGALEDRYFIRKGDIVISWSATLGVYRWNGPNAWLNQHIFKAIAKDEVINNGFFYYAVTRAVDQMSQAAHGSTMQHVTSSAFAESPVLLPPLPEQRKIAEILGSVDENIEKTEALIAKLQDLKKATMQELLTKGIGHTKFKDSPVGRIPEEWEVWRLDEIAEIVGGGTPDTSRPEYWGGSIPWATPTDITNLRGKYINRTSQMITDEGLRCSSAKLHPAGTVLITSRASIGFAAINTIPMATNQGFQSVRCGDRLDNHFLYYVINQCQPELSKLASGSTFLEVSSSNMKCLDVLLPPLPEQRKIAEILGSMDENIEKTQALIDKLQNLKKALMQDLLTGKVRVKV